jgi:hypothetical protein
LLPLQGGLNGDWYRGDGPAQSPVANYYVQALGQKNAIRDALARHTGETPSYPECALVFVPGLPAGSRIPPSDFKVGQIDLPELPTQIARQASTPWKLADVRSLAKSLGLVAAKDVETACSQSLSEAQARLYDYRRQYGEYYGGILGRHVPTRLTLDGAEVAIEDVLPQATARHAVLLKGPSGVGKTMIARQIAHDALADFVPVYLQAKNFAGLLGPSLNAEVTLLGAPSARALVRDATRLGHRVVVIVDGLNECEPDLRTALLRAIGAAIRKYGVAAVVTSNVDLPPIGTITIAEIAVHAPTLEQRRKIAEQNAQTPLNADAQLLLASITTGLEAAVLGEVGNTLPAGSSRFALLDTFIRRRAGVHAPQAVALLSAIAHRLHELLSFSLSLREAERLLAAASIPVSAIAQTVSTGLLVIYGDRISFCHELFLGASAAEAVVRRAASPADIAAALRAPKHNAHRILIVGAIERQDDLVAVLHRVEDSEVFRACIRDECGVGARAYTEKAIDAVLEKSLSEAGMLSFKIGKDFMWQAGLDDTSVAAWTGHEGAVLAVMTSFTWSAPVLGQVLAGMRAMDERIALARTELRQAAKDLGLGSIYSGMFAACHLFCQRSGPGMARISSVIGSGMARFNEDMDMAPAFSHIERTDLSPGELYILLGMFRGSGLEQYAKLAAHLPRLFEQRWRGAPYHLQLDMLDACHKCGKADDPVRQALIDMLQDLKMPDHSGLNSVLIDALGALGALENDEQDHAVHLRTMMEQVLAAPLAETSPAQAWHLYFGQFDHPYSGAYCEVVGELEEADRKTFMTAAATAAALEDSDLFTVPLIMELTKFNDPALAHLIVPWTRPPRVDSVMRDEGVGAFRNAWIALGRLGHEFEPAEAGSGEGGSAFQSYGQALYWLNRHDLEAEVRHARARGHLQAFAAHRIDLAVGILSDTEYRNSWTAWEGLDELKFAGTITHVREVLGAEVCDLCRRYMAFSGQHQTYFAYPNLDDMMDLCLQIIGLYGTEGDISALKAKAADRSHGRAALAAIKSIEERLYSSN